MLEKQSLQCPPVSLMFPCILYTLNTATFEESFYPSGRRTASADRLVNSAFRRELSKNLHFHVSLQCDMQGYW